MLLLIGSAMAMDLVGSAGAEVSINDPFTNTVGVRLGLETPVRPWLTLGLTGSTYPDLGESAHTNLLSRLLEEYKVSPNISDLRWRGTVEAHFVPLEVASGGWTRRLAAHIGLGAIHTIDDDSMLFDNPDFLLTQVQIHPMTLMGLSGEIYRDRLGLRLRIERTSYSEDTMMDTQSRNHGWVGVEMTVRGP